MDVTIHDPFRPSLDDKSYHVSSRPFETKGKVKPTSQQKLLTPLRTDLQAEPDTLWWREAVIYQLYVPSFKDTNNDGFGDLRGITENVEYLAQTGFDVVWLSPIFDSPMYDMGYDIRDYYKVNPLYGSMQDFEELVDTIHANGMRVILDIAVNHASCHNVWMKESIAAHLGEDNGKKDFFMWGDLVYDEQGNKMPPNNWQSVFQGSMWKYVPEIDKYFLHVFGDEQADLNWDSPATRHAVYDVLRFWLDKGIDGFRLDAINCVSKVPGWPDAEVIWPDSFVQKANEMFANGPNVHKYLHEMYEEVFRHYPHAMTLGEMSCGITPEVGVDFISREQDKRELDLIIHFEHIELDCYDGDKWLLREWKVPELKNAVTKWQDKMAESGGWDTIWVENHDQPRSTTRFVGREKSYHQLGAKLLAIWLFTLQGTVLVYHGQELGMQNPEEFSEDMLKDIETMIFWNALEGKETEADYAEKLVKAKTAILAKGRDNSRIPFPWKPEKSTYCGFTSENSTKPWLPADLNMAESCVEKQQDDMDSVWAFYRKMIKLRKAHKTLIYGIYQIVDPDHPHLFAYTRTLKGDKYLVVLNFSKNKVAWQLPRELGNPEEWLLLMSNHNAEDINEWETSQHFLLRPYEGKIWRACLGDEGYFGSEQSASASPSSI